MTADVAVAAEIDAHEIGYGSVGARGAREILKIGDRRYFSALEQWDGFLSESDAVAGLSHEEDSSAYVGQRVNVIARQFAGIHKAELTFGPPNERGGRKSSSWKWKGQVPRGATFFELCADYMDTTFSHSSAADPSEFLLGIHEHRYGYGHEEPAPDTKIVRVACWIDLATTQYVVQLRRLDVRI